MFGRLPLASEGAQQACLKSGRAFARGRAYVWRTAELFSLGKIPNFAPHARGTDQP
jgi:hypothetical protein